MNPIFHKATPAQKIRSRIYSKLNEHQSIIDQLSLPSPESLDENEVAPIYKHVNSTQGDIWYEDDAHVYFLVDSKGVRKPLISATTLLGAFETPFNESLQADRCAAKHDYNAKCLDKTDWPTLNKQERKKRILTAWEQNRDQASYYGTATHAALEYMVKNKTFDADEAYTFVNKKYEYENEIIRKFADDFAARFYSNITTASHQIVAEPILYDLDLMVAGQSDLVIIDWSNRLIHVADYKTNIKKPGGTNDAAYNNFQGVLNHLPQTKQVHYGLQIALYQTMLIKMFAAYGQIMAPGLNYLLWANRDTGSIESIEVKYSDYAKDVQRIYDYLLN